MVAQIDVEPQNQRANAVHSAAVTCGEVGARARRPRRAGRVV